jgi:hypothetical protein
MSTEFWKNLNEKFQENPSGGGGVDVIHADTQDVCFVNVPRTSTYCQKYNHCNTLSLSGTTQDDVFEAAELCPLP